MYLEDYLEDQPVILKLNVLLTVAMDPAETDGDYGDFYWRRAPVVSAT